MTKLFEELNNDFSKIIKIQDFIKVDRNLKNFKSISVSVAVPPTMDITENIISNVILSEIVQTIHKMILREVNNVNTNSFVDIRADFGTTHFKVLEKLCEPIINSDFKYTVTNSRLAVDIQDSAGFSISPSGLNSSANVYLTGHLRDKKLYVDPYMRWNDYKIFLFDEVLLNIENFSAMIVSEATFAPRLVVKFDIDFLVSPGNTLNIIDLENQDALLELRAEYRNQQIDKIIKEDL